MEVISRRATAAVAIAALGAFATAGCARLSPDGGLDGVSAVAGSRLGQNVVLPAATPEPGRARAETARLLAQPLTADDAVQVALLNNPALRIALADVRIAEADWVQAGRLGNPRFSTIRTRSDEGFKYETSFTFPVLGLFTMPMTRKMERRRLEAVQFQVADRALQLAVDTRRAYFEACAAEEQVRYLERVHEASDIGAELAARMAEAGNFSRLDQLREKAFELDARTRLTRARNAAQAARERLTRLLGLAGDDARYRLPERLPDLPASLAELGDVEATALGQRLDVLSAKRGAESTAASLGLVKTTRFINALELGPATLLEDGHATKKGYELSVELPLFDWGGARVARAEALYMQAVQRVAEVAVQARSEVREAHANYRLAWETARQYRDELLPVRRKISQEHLLRYNGMLMSVFELLADQREQISATSGYIDALREFWLAEAQLQQALGGRFAGTATAAPAAPGAPAPSSPAHDHSKG